MNADRQVVLVTGASSGIGKAITALLAAKGMQAYAGARKDRDLEELDAIENVRGIRLDVTKPDDIEDAVQRIEAEEGCLDGLVNNAGLMGWGAVIDREIDYFKTVFEVNLWGAVRMVKALYPLLKKSPNKPTVFNISSQGANYTLPFWSPYHMSKYALEAFSSSLRREFLNDGIRVVSIAPGAFKSGMLAKQKKALDEYEERYNSFFTAKVVKMLAVPVRGNNRKELSPDMIGDLIYKLLRSDSCKARYQPGKRLIPDVLLETFPTKLVDRIVLKMIQ